MRRRCLFRTSDINARFLTVIQFVGICGLCVVNFVGIPFSSQQTGIQITHQTKDVTDVNKFSFD